MLKAHLDPELEAASRKHIFIDDSSKWIKNNLKNNDKLLDLGCGPGLYTKRFSDIGLIVTGIDISKRSIDFAKSQDNKTEYICKNYLELDYSNLFDVITMIYCDYGALTKRKSFIKNS